MSYSDNAIDKRNSDNIPPFSAARLGVQWIERGEDMPATDWTQGEPTINRKLASIGGPTGPTFARPRGHKTPEHLNYPRLAFKQKHGVNTLTLGKRIGKSAGLVARLRQAFHFAQKKNALEPGSEFRDRIIELVLESGINAPETVHPDGEAAIRYGIPQRAWADSLSDWLGLAWLAYFWHQVAEGIKDFIPPEKEEKKEPPEPERIIEWAELREKIAHLLREVENPDGLEFVRVLDPRNRDHVEELRFKDGDRNLWRVAKEAGESDPFVCPDTQDHFYMFSSWGGDEFARLAIWFDAEHRKASQEGLEGITPGALKQKIGVEFLKLFYSRVGDCIRLSTQNTGQVIVQCGTGNWLLAELSRLFMGEVRRCADEKCKALFVCEGKLEYCSSACRNRANFAKQVKKDGPGIQRRKVKQKEDRAKRRRDPVTNL